MIHRTLSLDDLKALWSNDHHCRVGELSRTSYELPKHVDIFNDLSTAIQRDGITTPLRVVSGMLVDGHHRAIVAMELGIPTIPIAYEGVL